MYRLDSKYVPPDRKTIRERKKEEYSEKISQIKNLLKYVSKVNLTCGIWTSLVLDPYLGITAHYIDASGTMRSHILDVSLFPHRHDSISITDALKNLI